MSSKDDSLFTPQDRLLLSALTREHVFVGKKGPCYYCGVLKKNAKYTQCSLEEGSG
jgi:hypothetical protein